MALTTAQSFNHVAIYVSDMRTSADWYIETLGMQEASASDNHIFLRLADGTVLALFEASDQTRVGSGVHHLALNLPPGEKDAALEHLRERGVELSRRGPSPSFQDPDGYWIHFS